MRVTAGPFVHYDRTSGPEKELDDPPLEVVDELIEEVAAGYRLYLTISPLGDEFTFLQLARDESDLLVGSRLGEHVEYVEARTTDYQRGCEAMRQWFRGENGWQDGLNFQPI